MVASLVVVVVDEAVRFGKARRPGKLSERHGAILIRRGAWEGTSAEIPGGRCTEGFTPFTVPTGFPGAGH